MPNVGRTCVFCGRSANSREHVYRDKLRNYLETSNIVFDLAKPNHQPRQHGFFDRTVRRVCTDCNSGWMNDLENRVEEDLVAMMAGEPVVLDVDRSTEIATWAVKTAMMRSFSDPQQSLDLDHPPALMRTGQPPYGWAVLVGRGDAAFGLDRLFHFTLTYRPSGRPVKPAQLMQLSVVLDQVALYVLGLGDGFPARGELLADFCDYLAAVGDDTKPTSRLWPDPEPTTWPKQPMTGEQYWLLSSFGDEVRKLS